jgi:dihydrofolate synthase / folylpolyglutamate synthase
MPAKVAAAAAFSRQANGQQLYSPALRASLARLDALVDWERRTRARGAQRVMRVDSRPSAALLAAVGSPHTAFRTVHVTGSKGKGSVAALVGAGLAAAGVRVGVYGSPHVERVNERVHIGGAPVADDALAAALDGVLDAREWCGLGEATWFDVISAAGMLAFRNAGVEWAVVEVGLGGRLDSTNVLSAPVAVVTNIALEHADIIGPTVRDIAYEKAGIFCRGCQPIVGMASSDPLASIFDDEATLVGACSPCYIPPASGASLSAHNAALARRALQSALPVRNAAALLPDDSIASILSSLPGRMERFRVCVSELDMTRSKRSSSGGAVVDVTLDGAHVAASVRRVLGEVASRTTSPPVVVLALGKEKDAAGICCAVAEASPPYVVVTRVSPEDPYMDAGELRAVAAAAGIGQVLAYESPDVALARAAERAASEGTHLIVIGSLHLAGRVRPALRSASVAKA